MSPDDDRRDDARDPELARLLGDAVADVEPHDRLGEIRRRTSHVPRRARRRWPLVVLGAGITTAAVVGGVAVVGGLGLPGSDDDPAASGGRQAAVATYFVGSSPLGPRLFREFQAISPSDEEAPLALAALRLLETDAGPLDPDYSTTWPDGAFTAVTVTTDRIEVRLADKAVPMPADPAVQQAVFTVQAALGSTLPVRFTTATGTVAVGDQDEVRRDTALLAPVNITDPAEGHGVDDLLTVRGVVSPAGTAPRSVTWQLRTTGGTGPVTVAASGSAPVADRAWEQTTAISDVAPGTYLLVVSVPVSRNGARDTATDTRTLTVR